MNIKSLLIGSAAALAAVSLAYAATPETGGRGGNPCAIYSADAGSIFHDPFELAAKPIPPSDIVYGNAIIAPDPIEVITSDGGTIVGPQLAELPQGGLIISPDPIEVIQPDETLVLKGVDDTILIITAGIETVVGKKPNLLAPETVAGGDQIFLGGPKAGKHPVLPWYTAGDTKVIGPQLASAYPNGWGETRYPVGWKTTTI